MRRRVGAGHVDVRQDEVLVDIHGMAPVNEKGVACVSILVPVEQHLNTWKWSKSTKLME